MFKKFPCFALCAALAVVGYSCDKEGETPDEPDEPKGEMAQMTPTESKTFLETTATEFMNKFRAADQQTLIELAAWVNKEYGDLDYPAEFEVDADNDENDPGPAKVVARLLSALAKGDASRAATAANTYIYTLNFNRFTGVYEPGTRSWIRSGASNDIIFRFKNSQGGDCELKAAAADGTSDFEYSVNGSDWSYNPATGGYEETGYVDKYKLSVPKKVTLTLTSGGTTLVDALVTSDINTGDHKMSLLTNITAANISVKAAVDGTDTEVKQVSTYAVSEEVIVSTTATVTGNNLCNISNYNNLTNKEDISDDDLLAIAKNGTAVVSVLNNKVRIEGSVELNREVLSAFDTEWDRYEFDSQNAARTDCEKAIAALNKYVKAIVTYENTKTEQASLFWDIYCYEGSGDYWYYERESKLKFAADGTTYDFDEYFETGFGNVENLWDDLSDNYEKVWDNAKK